MMRRVGAFLQKNTILPIFSVLFIVIASITPGFLAPKNLLNVLLQSSIFGTMALGATFVIISGFRDLSVGMVMNLAAALTITLQKHGLFLSIAVALSAALLVGFINGFLVIKAGINTFIATLATMYGCRGFVHLYSGSRTMPATNEAFKAFGSGTAFGVSYLVIVFVVMLLLAHFILRYTTHGRNSYACGGNVEAAVNAGINSHRTFIANFMICSLGAGIGGILMAARTASYYPEMGWPDTHFIVIVMVVLGGTKLIGGIGNVFYTLGGVLTLITFQNAFNLLAINAFFQPMFTGLILIASLYLDQVIKPVAINTSATSTKGRSRKRG